MAQNTENTDHESQTVDEPAADQPPAETAEAQDPVEDLPAQLAKAQEKSEKNYNDYIRLAAEVDNLRKRSVRDVEHARKFGAERLANELLAVVDSLEMGIDAGADASAETLLEGQQATLKLLLGALTKAGIESVDPAGEPFDPNLHEALTMQPSDVAEPGSVLTVVQKGYQLNGRLLRPARVIVASEA